MNFEEKIATDLVDHIKQNMVASDVPFHENTTLQEAGIDSYALIELVLFLEQKFGVSLQEGDLIPAHFKTAKTLAKLAASRSK